MRTNPAIEGMPKRLRLMPKVECPLYPRATDGSWPEAVVLVISDIAVATARE